LDGSAPTSAIKKTGDDYPLACTHITSAWRPAILATGTLEEYRKSEILPMSTPELPRKTLALQGRS